MDKEILATMIAEIQDTSDIELYVDEKVKIIGSIKTPNTKSGMSYVILYVDGNGETQSMVGDISIVRLQTGVPHFTM